MLEIGSKIGWLSGSLVSSVKLHIFSTRTPGIVHAIVLDSCKIKIFYGFTGKICTRFMTWDSSRSISDTKNKYHVLVVNTPE